MSLVSGTAHHTVVSPRPRTRPGCGVETIRRTPQPSAANAADVHICANDLERLEYARSPAVRVESGGMADWSRLGNGGRHALPFDLLFEAGSMPGDVYPGAAASSTAHIAVIRAGVRCLTGSRRRPGQPLRLGRMVSEDATR